MDYVAPGEVIANVLTVARKKADLSILDLLVRGILAGALLGYATSLAQIVVSQGVPPVVGAILFPAGFVILVLLGLELATGNFALLPLASMTGDVSFSAMLRNWGWVYLGNLLGSVLYAALFYLAITNCGASDGGPLGELVRQAAQKKTLAYMALGARGWFTAMVKGILCNWMVTLGAVLALVSRSTFGKVTAMWLPIMMFFALGYEHSIVNMYVIPAGQMLGAPIPIAKWWLWNQIPVTLGNIFAGVVLTAWAFFRTYHTKAGPVPAEPLAPALVSPALASEPARLA
ncbi:MAG TPA: formate/nitrite transporter family protein [Terriglobales bacterium]|nr:formate/nitrite transporter family protein [Terriglobales bacterium]